MKGTGVVLGVLAVMPTALAGQQPEREAQGFARHLFPPELIMQYQRQIGLTAEQRSTITGAIRELQGRVVELQWQMQDQNQRLAELLAQSPVDSAAALAQVDRILDTERQVKRAHLALLIRIKNTLTQDQRDQLRRLRAGAEGTGPPDG